MAKQTSGPADLNVAHQGSGHVCPGPPTPSGGPAPQPSGTGWIPAPYMYISRSATLHPASGSGKRTVFGGNRACVDQSYLDVDEPANLPAKPGEKQPTGADLSNQAIIGVAQIQTASGQAYSKKKKFAVTMDQVFMCLPGENAGKVHLSQGVLLDAGAPGMTFEQMNQHAAQVLQSGDPVNVVTGAVIDETMDFRLPGKIVLELWRLYRLGRALEKGPFGRGGFTHSLHQWLEEDEPAKEVVIRREDGQELRVPRPDPGDSVFIRRTRQTLARHRDGSYDLTDHVGRHTRHYAALSAGGRLRLQSFRDSTNHRIVLHYQSERLTRVTDTAFRELRFQYDAGDRIERIEVWGPQAFHEGEPGPLKLLQHMDYHYTGYDELAGARDALGYEEQYAYDTHHRLIKKTLKNGLSFHYQYEQDGPRCIRSVADGNLQNTELLYEDAKQLVTVHGNPEPRVYQYDERGEVVQDATFDGNSARIVARDEDGFILSIANAAGDEVAFEYDERGNVLCERRGDGTELRWEYEDDLIVKRIDPGERVSSISYDAHGGMLCWTQPSGRSNSYDRDEHGRLAAIHDATGVIMRLGYDEQHNLITETDALGNTSQYTYDAMGRLVKEADPLGRQHQYSYDMLGRLLKEKMPDGTVVSYSWDAMGNAVSISDGLTSKTMTYAGTGMVATRTEADGRTWRFRYDLVERLREIENPKTERYGYNYDRIGHTVEVRRFDGELVQRQYSRRNLLSRIQYLDETWLEFDHDSVGRVIKELSPHGDCSYEYNEVGWLKEAVLKEFHGTVVTRVEHDVDGRVVSNNIDGKEVCYEYDDVGMRIARTLPNGEVTRYQYDAAGQLTAIDHEGEWISFQRDALGREVRRHYHKSGIDCWKRYTDNDRLAGIAVGAARQPTLVERKWEYGPHARLTARQDARWGAVTYRYDQVGRLSGYERGAEVVRYEYDAAGALMKIHHPDVPSHEPWALRMGNLLLRSDSSRYDYDDRRRRRRVRPLDGDGGETELFWDCRNQLREVRLPDGDRILYVYDALGRCVRKALVGAPGDDLLQPPVMRFIEYVWDEMELAMIIDSEHGETVFVNIPGTFEPVLQRSGGKSFGYICDHLGTPTELIDADGRVALSMLTDPWGKLTDQWQPEGESVQTPFRLLGQILDPETQLRWTSHRWFDAETARWLSPDPIELLGGPDLFGFNGSPTVHADPFGLYTEQGFQKFLNDTHQPRVDANNAALCAQRGGNPNGRNRMGPATAGAARPIRPGQKPGQSKNSGCGNPGHAERNPLRESQGLPSSSTQSGVGAVGAGRPHCANCTHSIINTPGAVTSSRIRGQYTGRDGQVKNSNGFAMPPSPANPSGFL